MSQTRAKARKKRANARQEYAKMGQEGGERLFAPFTRIFWRQQRASVGSRWLRGAFAGVSILLLTGCGLKGPLYLPPEAAAPAAAAEKLVRPSSAFPGNSSPQASLPANKSAPQS